MEISPVQIHIGARLKEFQAAAACLSVRPLMRRAARYCWIVGGLTLLFVVVALRTLPLSSPFVLENLLLVGVGFYLYSPFPRPAALLLGAAAIAGIWAQIGYDQWVAGRGIHVDPVAVTIELLLAFQLVVSYFSYRRNRAETDEEVLSELTEAARRVMQSDPGVDEGIVAWQMRQERMHLRRVEDLVLIASDHRVFFRMRSKLDAVILAKIQDVAVAVAGTVKPGRDLRLKVTLPSQKKAGKRTIKVKMKPEYAGRLAAMGLAVEGLPRDVVPV